MKMVCVATMVVVVLMCQKKKDMSVLVLLLGCQRFTVAGAQCSAQMLLVIMVPLVKMMALIIPVHVHQVSGTTS